MASQIYPKLTKFEKASKLADLWVDGASGSAADQNELEFVGRTERVGLGIKTIPNDMAGSSADPVARKLQWKINAAKKKSAKNYENDNPAEESRLDDSDDDDDEPESRIKALAKKRTHLATRPQHPIKRSK